MGWGSCVVAEQLKLKCMQARFSWIAQHRGSPGRATGVKAGSARLSRGALSREHLDRVART